MALDASPALVSDRVFADGQTGDGDGGDGDGGNGNGDGGNGTDKPTSTNPGSVTWLDLFNEMMQQGGSATSILSGGKKGLGEMPTTSGSSPAIDYPYIPAPPVVRDGSVIKQLPTIDPETPAFEGPVVINERVPIPMSAAVRLVESRKGDVTRDSLEQMIRYPKSLEPGVLEAAKYIWQNFDTIRDISAAGSKTGDKLSSHDLNLLADLIVANQKDHSAKKSSLKDTYTDYELSREDAPYVAGITLTVTGIAMLAARRSGLRGIVGAGSGGLALGKTVSKPVVDKLIEGGVKDYYKNTAGPAIDKLFINGDK